MGMNWQTYPRSDNLVVSWEIPLQDVCHGIRARCVDEAGDDVAAFKDTEWECSRVAPSILIEEEGDQ